jgi:hypothetical protein
MTVIYRASAVLICLLACIACEMDRTLVPSQPTRTAEDLWLMPVLKPEFIVDLEISTNDAGLVMLYVQLNDTTFWTPGDYGSDVYLYIQGATRISIDGSSPAGKDLGFYGPLVVVDIYDNSGTVIGSHGEGTGVSIDVTQLADGIHRATIQLASKSGELYEYSWAFQLTTEDGTRRGLLPPGI